MKQENLNSLIAQAIEIEELTAKKAGAIGFMGRALVLATMPHKKPQTNEFVRKNGHFTLTMLAPSTIGLPYGPIPRLLMAWVTTEAVRTKERQLILGKTLRQFMKQLGLIENGSTSGGERGNITSLKTQMRKLFASSISCQYKDDDRDSGINIQIIENYDLWWDPKSPDQLSLWESSITLGQRFFDELIKKPVPIDMRVIKAIKRSPLALDMYCWLTHRMSYLEDRTDIPWPALKIQFGANYACTEQGTRDFKRAFLRELKKIFLFYPNVKIQYDDKSLSLLPGKTHISMKKELS